jgi:hypothetical protein
MAAKNVSFNETSLRVWFGLPVAFPDNPTPRARFSASMIKSDSHLAFMISVRRPLRHSSLLGR